MNAPLDGPEAPTDKWTTEDHDPAVDDPPEDHHAQPDEDPPDIEDDVVDQWAQESWELAVDEDGE